MSGAASRGFRKRAVQASAGERALDRAARKRSRSRYLLRLYVAGLAGPSAQAIARVRSFCGSRLPGRHRLEVVDVYQLPAMARREQIVVTPTLIKVLPRPLRRFVGNMTDVDRLLTGLGLGSER